MILTHIEFTQFGKKAVFYFNAPARVDFRELVKDLVYDLKMRIELRQISVRDRAAALGSVGACGMQTCCSTFLKNYGNVSIKMAKNQNLALIPSKLNGVCGQIKCCIKYEDEVYTDKRKNLPKEGQFIKTKNGDIGKVLKLNVLVEQFEMLTDLGARRNYSAGQYLGKESDAPSTYRFPESFEHVVNETQNLIL
jgi:cell fate regulator YaaT (PSP1 superfamily)